MHSVYKNPEQVLQVTSQIEHLLSGAVYKNAGA